MKKNCWEFMQCGREPLGKNVKELGVCPAAAFEKLDGANGGVNAGRTCWLIAGTLCGGEVQGTYARKYQSCTECEFYQSVNGEEKNYFVHTERFINSIKAAG